MNVPTKLDFAQEVRAERLSLLWKVTLVLSLFLVWGTLILTSLNATNPAELFIPIVIVVLGCPRLPRVAAAGSYPQAVWAYIIGLMAAIALMSRSADPASADSRQLVMFAFPVIILLVGFLLPIRATLVALILGVLLVLLVPVVGQTNGISSKQIFVTVLMVLAAGIAAQMSGALYGIAEWALESYRKERETKEQLFDSQQEIQRSFLRQKALPNNCKRQIKNSKLPVLRHRSQELPRPISCQYEPRTPYTTQRDHRLQRNHAELPDDVRESAATTSI